VSTEKRILVVDDEPNMIGLFRSLLEKDGYVVAGAETGAEARLQLERSHFDLMVCDLALPDTNGIEVLRHAHELDPDLMVVMITGFGTIESAVEAMKLGARDYITKPFQRNEIKLTIAKALEEAELRRELKRLREEVGGRYRFDAIIGKSKAMEPVFDLIRRVAPASTTVLIEGESGTGKELVAKAIHYNSSRKNHSFVAVDCGVIPETLMESELFGHVRGAFTGADTTKRGLFSEASGGTLFLDEIGNLPAQIQNKLLRVLQEREIRPLGSNTPIKVDVRVVVATNTPLKQLVDQGSFREDLYYRVAVLPIHLPPLRERREDIPLLADHFLRKLESAGGARRTLSSAALRLLLEFSWPGNVRELENVIERAVLVCDGDEIQPRHLPPELRAPVAKRPRQGDLDLKQLRADQLRQSETQAILSALAKARGNRSEAARILKISRGSLYNKMQEYGIGGND
jgi:DNA-binding NtrC family response regulator